MKRFLVVIAISFLLAGCIKPYTPPIQQGNVITPADIAKLKIGMSKDDVQYILGQPILQPTFNNNEWDYLYTYEPKDEAPIKEQQLSLFFNNDGRLINFQTSSSIVKY